MNRYVYNQSIIRRIFENLKCIFFYNTCSSTLPLFQRSKSSPSSQAIVIPPSFHLLQHRKYRKIGSIRLTIEGRESHSTFPFPRQTWLSSRAAPPDNGLSSWWAIDWHARPEVKTNVFDQDDPATRQKRELDIRLATLASHFSQASTGRAVTSRNT